LILGVARGLVGGIAFFPDIKAPPIKAEPVFGIGSLVITNSMLGAMLAFLITILLVSVLTRKLVERPGKLQTAVEYAVGGLYNFAKGAGGSSGASLFPLFAGLFIWLLVNNWIALIPGFGQILVRGPEGAFPLFRAANADFNNTLALALMVFFLIHISGVRTHGIAYFAEFINIPALLKGRVIDFVVGIFHTIGEFAKIISLSFRLFANIYGGEILIAVIVGLAGPIAVVFYGLEVLIVAVIQSLIFGLLALIYISLVSESEEHPGDHDESAPSVQPRLATDSTASQARPAS
jgi:F-type H+-transporting ATPase subunit a